MFVCMRKSCLSLLLLLAAICYICSFFHTLIHFIVSKRESNMIDISFLIDRLAPLVEKKLIEEYDLFFNSKTEALNLSSSLKDIQKVLEEAEKRRLTDPRIKGWIERLQDVTYDIDDVLDEWAQIEGHYKADTDEYFKLCMEKVCVPIKYPCFKVKRFHRRRQIALKIRDLSARVDLLDKETVKYSLLPVISDTQDSQLDISTPYTELFNLVPQKCQARNLGIKLSYSGGEQAHKKLVILPGQVNEIQVYSLVGLAGVGKTTIAQLVFHDATVKDTFSLRLWACVSNCLDGFGVCKAILDALKIRLPPNTSSDFQTLLHYIESFISEEKFFLVLDDVRIEDDSMWKELKACFRYGKPGSRILVTTRNKKVAKVIGHASKIESVDPLIDYHCGLLLKWFTFQGRKKKDFRELKRIASLMGKKCKGMPLTAKTLGIYLNSTDSEHLWREALTKELWEFGEKSKTIFAPLASSYKDLPLVLKHCLSYSATFLSSCEIEVHELIRLWSVHGYFDFGGTKVDVDTRGQEYVEKLTEHSFFKKCSSDHSKRFARIYMHDIVHDFAQYLLINESKVKQLRYINCKELTTEQQDLKYARLMILKCCFELPVTIGSMIHLRYLDLKGTTIVQLPASICDLFNLQTLDLQNCEYLCGLPEKIHKLRKNLRFLLLEGTKSLKRLPKGIKRLTSLQTLDQFVVGKDGSKLEYLEKMNKLEGSLSVSVWTDLTEREVATAAKAKLKDKIKLSDLNLFIWADVVVEVMEALEPPSNLLSLCMDGYVAPELPRWFNTSLHSIKKLEIKSCDGLSHLPPLGMLHSLEELKISTMASLKFVGPEFVGTFSSYGARCSGFLKLKILTFMLCPLLHEWKDISDQEEPTLLPIMPNLDSLTVSYCATLARLPNRLLGRTSCRRRLISRCPLLLEMSA